MLTIRVHGTPGPQGSKRHVGNGVMIESSKKVQPWRQDVKSAAIQVPLSVLYPLDGPVRVTVQFLLRRPKSHYRTGRNSNLLREAAPKWPSTKPDIDKLQRSTLDALGEAGVWRDDSQVVDIRAWKSYADGETPGAVITVAAVGA